MPALLDVRGLTVQAQTGARPIALLDDISFTLQRGEVLGLIGESGSGKTTTVRSVIGLLDRNVSVSTGEIDFLGDTVRSENVDRLREARGKQIGMIFQGVGTSLDPLMRVGKQIVEVARRNRRGLSAREAKSLSIRTIASMGFDDPEHVFRSYPHELSGGMRQRVSIALAMVTEPDLLIADECTSALDVTTQKSVVNLLSELVSNNSMGMLFVTHDLMLAEEICTTIAVMKSGRIVEYGPVAQVLSEPKNEYTKSLLSASPRW